MVFGISRGGRSSEELFFELTGAEKAASAAVGDAVLDGHLVEVKRATSNTLNQVRAVKYLPLVAHFVPTDSWYIVPPHVVVALVNRKKRGQHTENPFESATLSLSSLARYRVMDPQMNLRGATLAAVQDGEKYGELRAAMASVLEGSRTLAEQSRQQVRQIMAKYGLE